MDTRNLARGGVLTASSVALLYVGSAAPWTSAIACVAAGTTSAVPLLRGGQIRSALLLYTSVSLLGALTVPRKVLVLVYIGVSGLYPILKYVIEARVPFRWQTGCKLLYCFAVTLVCFVLIRLGFAPKFPPLGFLTGTAFLLADFVAFHFYDVSLSRLIALLRRILPP